MAKKGDIEEKVIKLEKNVWVFFLSGKSKIKVYNEKIYIFQEIVKLREV